MVTTCQFALVNIFQAISSKFHIWTTFIKLLFKSENGFCPKNDNHCKIGFRLSVSRVGISGTTAKSRQREFVPSSHPGPFAVVATSRKTQTKVGTLACFDLL